MTPTPDRELLTQTAARELLERAGQIDSDSTSVETLRSAAREAGISEAAFEAALTEMRRKEAGLVMAAPPRPRRRIASTLIAVAAMIGAAAVFFIIPVAVRTSQPGMTDHEILVQCLPMRVAQDIAQTQLRSPGNEVQISLGSRVLRVRSTDAQFKALQATFEATAKTLTSCDNTPAGR